MTQSYPEGVRLFEGQTMLGWAIAFFVAAVAVGTLGVETTAITLSWISKVLFWIFLGFTGLSLALHFTRTRA